MKKIFLLLAVIFFWGSSPILSSAQLPSSMTGSWKRTAINLVDVAGKSSDLQASMLKSMPCTKNIVYTFKSDGSFITEVPDECGSLKKTIESMNGIGKCTMTGNKLTVSTSQKTMPPATYEVQIRGNTMTWFFDYTTNPKELNVGGHSKSMTITYTKI